MIRIIFLSILILRIGNAFALESLALGTGITDENFSQIVPVSMEYAIADLALGDEDGVVTAFYKNPKSNDLYSVTSKMKINLTDYVSRELLGSWPLTRWLYNHRPTEIMDVLNQFKRGRDDWRKDIEFTNHFKMAGCLNEHPLRYGDIDGDAINELALFLDGEFIVFSPDHQRTVFSTFYQADDWYLDSSDYTSIKSEVDDKMYQWVSEMLILNGNVHGAHRSYTKTFVKDFNNNGTMDIVTWRKTYLSNEVGESEGFRLLANEYRHFERKGTNQGEYLPQEDTAPETIQGWLTANNLTWQKGFPSKSECAGQEGQLIPEMHDPLLNDPDVLQ